MPPLKLDLMPRDAFAALSLHERNDYLQRLAAEFSAKTNRPEEQLGKDALARLRRFYLRRSLADLDRGKTDLKVSDPELARLLRKLGETIKESERKTDLVGMLKAELPGPAAACRARRRPSAFAVRTGYLRCAHQGRREPYGRGAV
jgi:hypothetical protein